MRRLPKPTRDYRYLEQLDPLGWYRELTRLVRLSVDYDLGLVELSPDLILSCTWEGPGKETGTDLAHIGTQTIQLVGQQEKGYWLDSRRLPAIIVNPAAPDAIIIKELKKTLKEVRKYITPPVAKRGRYDLNNCFDKTTFEKWIDDRIVEFADLLAWNASQKVHNCEYYSEWVLGKWLGKSSARMTSETKKTLKKALGSLPPLSAQIANHWHAEEVSQQLTED
jgi:hypothetical protein